MCNKYIYSTYNKNQIQRIDAFRFNILYNSTYSLLLNYSSV